MTIDTEVLVSFRSALREGIARDLARTRRRNRRVRAITLAGAAAAVALAFMLFQPLGHGQSAIARARAALDLPAVGILHVTSRTADGHVAEEVWQSLSNPNEYRRLEADPQDASGPHESAISDSVWMRYDAATNTIYTQRVIEAVGAFSETVNLPDVRRSLGEPGSRDLGIVQHGGRQLREIQLPASDGAACTYYALPDSYLPASLECTLNGRPSGVTDYAFLADTPANRANFSLVSVHPDATVQQDPHGIPGKAGDDLASVMATGIEDATAGHAYLGNTDEVSMRKLRQQQIALNHALDRCFATHGAYRVPIASGEGYTVHDPTGTVGAICAHYGDGWNALQATPAGQALSAREVAHAQEISRCMDAHNPPTAQRDMVTRDCARQNADPFLASLPTYQLTPG